MGASNIEFAEVRNYKIIFEVIHDSVFSFNELKKPQSYAMQISNDLLFENCRSVFSINAIRLYGVIYDCP